MTLAQSFLAFAVAAGLLTVTPGLDTALVLRVATIEGRPYLLEIHIKREGIGAVSEWHPAYSIADQRSRKV